MISSLLRKRDLIFLAGLSRLGVGILALVLFNAISSDTRRGTWILWPYLAFAVIEQVLIRKRIGGRVRSFLAGLVDGVVVTFFAHRLGSVGGAMSGMYLLAAVLNTLVVGRYIGMALAIIYGVAFCALVGMERAGALPFAPDVPELAVLGRPPLNASLVACFALLAMLAASVTVVGMLVHALDTHERDLARANSDLKELSQRDALTGLANRRYLFSKLEAALGTQPLCVVMLDLDVFKLVNDTEGHLRGDMLLVELGQAMQEATRARDLVGRYGGDEFLVILPETTMEDALHVAERVTTSVASVGRKFGGSHPVTASVGVAEANEGDSVASLVRRADEACYRAKAEGGNRVIRSA